jgi:SAM-dependent methyltransferase
MKLRDPNIETERDAFYHGRGGAPFAVDRGRLAMKWLPRGQRLLDIGCGTGNHFRHLAAKSARATGVDLDRHALSLARRQVEGPSVSLLQCDARRLPFADASFDVVTTLDVIEHIAERQDVVAEIGRVLRPGGSWIVTVPYKGHVRWMSPENLAVDFPRAYRLLTAVGRTQFWIQFYQPGKPRHEHFRISELSELASPTFELVRYARRGSVVYGLAYLAASLPPPGCGAIFNALCFAIMALDYQVPYGPFSYNLAIEFRKRTVFG